MPPLPRKQAVALDLLERTSVFVHLDPRRPGVIVPQGFLKQPQLVLQIGLNMAIAIPDLNVGEEGISCTLSFNKRPHFCSLPWSSIYALIGEQGGGMVWPEDVPPEVVSQQRAAAKKDPRPRKPGLRAINGSAAPSSAASSSAASSSATSGGATASGSATASGADDHGEAADRNADELDAPTRRSESVRPAVVRRDVRSSTPQPPRLVQVVSNPARSDASQAAEDTAQPNPAPAREDAARPPATKRSRPPYLRLVD